MTGTQVRLVREALGLTTFALASALSVAVSTVYRWEASRVAKMDPLHTELLSRIAAKLPKVSRLRTKIVGKNLVADLNVDVLLALRVLIDFVRR